MNYFEAILSNFSVMSSLKENGLKISSENAEALWKNISVNLIYLASIALS
jgi:hypothetical protein